MSCQVQSRSPLPIWPGWGISAMASRLAAREDKGRRAGKAADAQQILTHADSRAQNCTKILTSCHRLSGFGVRMIFKIVVNYMLSWNVCGVFSSLGAKVSQGGAIHLYLEFTDCYHGYMIYILFTYQYSLLLKNPIRRRESCKQLCWCLPSQSSVGSSTTISAPDYAICQVASLIHIYILGGMYSLPWHCIA